MRGASDESCDFDLHLRRADLRSGYGAVLRLLRAPALQFGRRQGCEIVPDAFVRSVLWDDGSRRGASRCWCEKRHLFLSFPYVCPEPVLAK